MKKDLMTYLTPLVSVIIPSYNGEKYLKRAIESVLKQTYENLEIIVIDDGSTDSTAKIVLEIVNRDKRVILLKNEKNLGFVKTLNRGVEQALGKYIARLDDDDIWINGKKLAKQVVFMENNNGYVLVGGGIITTGVNEKEIARYLFPETDEKIRKTILIDNAFAHSAVLFTKDAFVKVGGYDEYFGFFADRDLWLKLGLVGKLYNFQDFFVYYLDKEQGSYGARNKEIRRRVVPNIKLRKKYRQNYPGYSRAVFLCWVSYFYSFLPFGYKLRPLLIKLRAIILGPPAYKFFK